MNLKTISLLPLLISFLINPEICKAQSVDDVLYNSTRILGNERIMLDFNNGSIEYFIFEKASLEDKSAFETLSNNKLFLSPQNGVPVYIRPLNPLNYSYSGTTDFIVDPINQEAAEAISSVRELTDDIVRDYAETAGDPNEEPEIRCSILVSEIIGNLEGIEKSLSEENLRGAILAEFKALQNLTFVDFLSTDSNLASSSENIAEIEQEFKDISDSLDFVDHELAKFLDDRSCDSSPQRINILTIKLYQKHLREVYNEQYKRIKNLLSAQELVLNEFKRANNNRDGIEWSIPLTRAKASVDSNFVLTLSIQSSGFKVSKDDEIVQTKDSTLASVKVIFRKFQRAVPEVTAGIIYTDLNFKTYGTTSDSTGQQFVGEPTENELEKFKASVMLNYVWFFKESPINLILPQIGIGLNTEAPTFLTGVGFRTGIKPLNRLDFSTGFAWTWTQKLQDLKVGDPVSGTADIEKDLTYSFNWPPKMYFSIQYDF